MISLFATQFLLEQLTYVVVVQVDCWHNNMTWCLTLKLDYALAKVGLYHLYAVLFQIWVHATLLSKHRLRFYQLLYVVVLQNAINNLVEFMSIFRPVYYTTVLFGFGGKLVQILVQMGNGVALNLRCFFAQLFPFLKPVCHIVTFGAYCPESGIMPFRICLVLQELLCCITMCCTHNLKFLIFSLFHFLIFLTVLRPISPLRA